MKRSSILPYKLVKYASRTESEILMTTRPEKVIRLPFIPKHLKFVNPESQYLLTELEKQADNDNRNSLSALGRLNITRLQQLSLSPSRLLSTRSSSPNTKLPIKAKSPKPRISNVKTIIKLEDIYADQESVNVQNKVSLATLDEIMWVPLRTKGAIPCSRENSQAVIIEDHLYIYGGQSREKHRDLSLLSMRKLAWKVLTTESSPPGRLGHSMVAHCDRLIVFGGWVSKKMKQTASRCSRSTFSFDSITIKWKKLSFCNRVPTARRNHSAVVLGRDMFIYGGISDSGRTLGDLHVLDLEESTWREVGLLNSASPGPRSHFTLTSVFHPNILKNSQISIQALSKHTNLSSVQNSGIYMIGGLDELKVPLSSVFILSFSKSQPRWAEINYTGKAPSPRHSHTAVSVHPHIFIFGGRNDYIPSQSLKDLYLFNVENLNWDEVQVIGIVPESRWGHCMVSYKNKILVLGGINGNSYMSSAIYKLETDTEYIAEVKGI